MSTNEKVKILQDMKIQADNIMEHPRQDIVVLKKEGRYCNVDVSCPFDTHVVEKEKEKVGKYQDLKWEFKKIKFWSRSEVMVIPIVLGALGTI